MSTYNMMERISKSGPRDLVPREPFAGRYSYARTDIEMTEGSMLRNAVRVFRKHWKVSIAFAVILELAIGLLVFSLGNTYEARAVLDIEPPGADAIGPGSQATSPPTRRTCRDIWTRKPKFWEATAWLWA